MVARGRALELLGCVQPVILAGMGGVARYDLVAAVTEAGGFGFLGMVRESPQLIAAEVERLRASGIERFGVNIIPAATADALLEQQLETIIGLRVPVVALFWDIDPGIVARLRAAGIVVAYQVGSVAEATAAERAGAQVIIAQGREAGGHVRSDIPLRALLPQVAGAVDAPVLAAGGLSTGGDLVASLALGAEGIVLGTAFAAATESFAHDYHKQRLVDATAQDTLLTDMFHINWPRGARVRVIANSVTAVPGHGAAAETPAILGEDDGRPIYRFSTDSPLRTTTGDLEAMALYAGTGVGSIREIRSARTIVADVVAEARALLAVEAEQAPGESASPACYADERGGAYMGELDASEAAAAVAELVARLRGLLTTPGPPEANGPPFSAGDVAAARWIVLLEATLPEPRPTRTLTTGGDADVQRRAGALFTRLPAGPGRTVLAMMLAQRIERGLGHIG